MTTQEILQGVHDWTNGKIVYDISVAHPDGQGNPTKYANLTAALGTGGANIPETLRKGGMSVKFVLSSDNNYIQARCMAQNFTTDVTQWQGVDDEPTTGSKNLVESGGVAKLISFDLGEPIANEYILSTDGTFNDYSSYPGIYARTGFIGVYEIKKIIIGIGVSSNNIACIAFYADASTSSYISDSAVNSGEHSVGDNLVIDVPNNAKYFAMCWRPMNENKVFAKLQNIAGSLSNISQDINAIIAPIVNEVQEMQVFDQELLHYSPVMTSGGFININLGTISEAATYNYSDFIKIIGNQFVVTQYFADLAGIAFYDKYKGYMSGYAKPSGEDDGSLATVNVPEGAVYMRVSCKSNKVSLFKLYSTKNQLNDSLSLNISETNSFIDTLLTVELGTLDNAYVVASNGNIVTNPDYRVTRKIKILAKRIVVRVAVQYINGGLAFYDKNENFIPDSGVNLANYAINSSVVVDVPENAVYFAYCARKNYVDLMRVLVLDIANSLSKAVVSEDSVNPCFYTATKEAMTFKKVLCIGDSLTEGAFEYKVDGVLQAFIDQDLAWPRFFADMSGRQTTNAGDSGESIKSWYEIHQNDDLSGHDACIIALGRNDYSSHPTTQEERLQYLTAIVNKVKNENQQIKIFIATLINYYTGSDADAVNADIVSIATSLSDCYLLDIHTYGKMVFADDAYSHCTALGYQILASYYFNYISYIMNQNQGQFKNIQFTGTDRSYN